MAEGVFFTNSQNVLPYENMLVYTNAYADTSSTSGLSDFDYTITVSDGDLIAIDTFVNVYTTAASWLGGDSGEVYAAVQKGAHPGDLTQTHPYYVRYNVEVMSGSGTFIPYEQNAPATVPPGKLKPTKNGQFNLILAGKKGITYQVETSTTLTNWTSSFYKTGTGTPITNAISPGSTNTCFYRITPISK